MCLFDADIGVKRGHVAATVSLVCHARSVAGTQFMFRTKLPPMVEVVA